VPARLDSPLVARREVTTSHLVVDVVVPAVDVVDAVALVGVPHAVSMTVTPQLALLIRIRR
jgi:hypothetical protein